MIIVIAVVINGQSMDSYSLWSLHISSLPPILANLNPDVRQGLLGCMLGDGHVQRTASGKCRYMVTAGAINLAYITHVFNVLLAAFCSINTLGPNYYKHIKSGYEQYRICTLTHPVFIALHALFYHWDEKSLKWVKRVPSSVIYWLDPICLAFLIMDDGYWNKDEKTLILCVEGFCQADVLLLVEALARIDIITTLRKRTTSHSDQRYRIRVNRGNIEIVRKLCLPHIVPSMRYKLNV